VLRISPNELQFQVAIRGWSIEKTAREAGVSVATASRAMRGMPVRGLTALQLVQGFRRHAPVLELIGLVEAEGLGRLAAAKQFSVACNSGAEGSERPQDPFLVAT
jgi:transcriptional regulator with XRE-family HTH domain